MAEPLTATSAQDKQVTIPVPEERVPEFYAFYARFLAAGRPGRRRGRCRGAHGHGCGHPREDVEDVTQEQTATGGTTPPPAPAA
jgi:hypothetical protein